jgi:site-specific recombinase XerD
MGDYEKYEADCKRIRKENKTLIKGFEGYLKEKNLSKNTIGKHVQNIDFFIDEFLLYEDSTSPADGVSEVSYFLGAWFIKKAMWATEAAIKSNIASLKNFYTWMNSQGKITDEELADLKLTIKEEKQEWIDTLKRYDDPDCDHEDVWGF